MSNNTNYSNNLKIAHWNSNGLQDKFNELKSFIENHNFDIITLNETKFTPKNNCKLPGYTHYRIDRPPLQNSTQNPGGGSLMLVKNTIKHSEVQVNNNSEIEIIGIRIGNLHVFSTYVPQDKMDETTIDALLSSSQRVIIIGDLNSRHEIWNCTTSNKNGRTLKNYLNNKSRYVLLYPDGHTHYPSNTNHNPSTIELAIVKNIKYATIETINDLDSDHLPIILTLNNSKTPLNPDKKFLNYSKANWNLFRNYINTSLKITTKLKTEKDIDLAINNITIITQNAIKTAIPLDKFKLKTNFSNDEIKNLIKERNKIRRKIQRTGCKILKSKRNQISKIINSKLFELNNKNWKNKLENVNPKTVHSGSSQKASPKKLIEKYQHFMAHMSLLSKIKKRPIY